MLAAVWFIAAGSLIVGGFLYIGGFVIGVSAIALFVSLIGDTQPRRSGKVEPRLPPRLPRQVGTLTRIHPRRDGRTMADLVAEERVRMENVRFVDVTSPVSRENRDKLRTLFETPEIRSQPVIEMVAIDPAADAARRLAARVTPDLLKLPIPKDVRAILEELVDLRDADVPDDAA